MKKNAIQNALHVISWALWGVLGVGLFLPGLSVAVGLGEIELVSALNQPLNARIVLTDTGKLEPSDITVRLGSVAEFETLGVARAQALNQLNFQIKQTPEEGATHTLYIQVTSTQPIKTPVLVFLLHIVWPEGSLARKYTLLLSPIYFEQTTHSEKIANIPQKHKVAVLSASLPVQSQLAFMSASRFKHLAMSLKPITVAPVKAASIHLASNNPSLEAPAFSDQGPSIQEDQQAVSELLLRKKINDLRQEQAALMQLVKAQREQIARLEAALAEVSVASVAPGFLGKNASLRAEQMVTQTDWSIGRIILFSTLSSFGLILIFTLLLWFVARQYFRITPKLSAEQSDPLTRREHL